MCLYVNAIKWILVLNKLTPQLSSTDYAFNVLVLATMSAGKTSFINALIGDDLLHSANEATTACITTIKHDEKSDEISACCYDRNGDLLASEDNIQAKKIKLWNSDSQVKNIILQGNFNTYISPSRGLSLHDTPGPNNSQDPRHAQLTIEAIQNIPFDAVFYLLDATQLGTRDDRDLLTTLKQELGRRQRPHIVVFILNKVDQLDFEKDESLTKHVEKAFSYLVEIGFCNPTIIPMIANAALYSRKKLAGKPLSRKQRLELENFKDDHLQDSGALLNASLLSDDIKNNVKKYMEFKSRKIAGTLIEQKELHLLMAYSGLAAVILTINRQRAVILQEKSRHQ